MIGSHIKNLRFLSKNVKDKTIKKNLKDLVLSAEQARKNPMNPDSKQILQYVEKVSKQYPQAPKKTASTARRMKKLFEPIYTDYRKGGLFK